MQCFLRTERQKVIWEGQLWANNNTDAFIMFRVQSSTAFWKQPKPKNAKRATGEGVFGNSCYFVMKAVSHFRNFKGKFPFSLYSSTFVFVCTSLCAIYTSSKCTHTFTYSWLSMRVSICVSCSVVSDSVTLWTVAHQAPLSMGILQARILEWVAIPFSRGPSQSRDQIQVSCIAGRFFIVRATREAPMRAYPDKKLF